MDIDDLITEEKKPVILLVDDMKANRTFLKNALVDSYLIYEAENGKQAYTMLLEKEGEIDLVLTDLMMPDADGFQLLQAVSRNRIIENVPIMVLTSYDIPGNEMKALEIGAIDFVFRTVDPCVLKRRISNILRLVNCEKKLKKYEQSNEK